MCDEVEVMPSGTVCTSQRELKRFCPTLTYLDGYGAPSDDTCLCPVDIRATARTHGYIARRRFGMEWRFFPKRRTDREDA